MVEKETGIKQIAQKLLLFGRELADNEATVLGEGLVEGSTLVLELTDLQRGIRLHPRRLQQLKQDRRRERIRLERQLSKLKDDRNRRKAMDYEIRVPSGMAKHGPTSRARRDAREQRKALRMAELLRSVVAPLVGGDPASERATRKLLDIGRAAWSDSDARMIEDSIRDAAAKVEEEELQRQADEEQRTASIARAHARRPGKTIHDNTIEVEAEVLFDYEPEHDGYPPYLTLKTNDRMIVTNFGADWWAGYAKDAPLAPGFFPRSYVKKVSCKATFELSASVGIEWDDGNYTHYVVQALMQSSQGMETCIMCGTPLDGLILNKIGERYVSSMSDGLVQDAIKKTRPLLLQFVYDVEHYMQGIPPPAEQKWVVVEEAPRRQAPSQPSECPTRAQDAARPEPVDPLGDWRKKIRQITAINAVKVQGHGDGPRGGPRDRGGSATPPPPRADRPPPAMPAGMAAPTRAPPGTAPGIAGASAAAGAFDGVPPKRMNRRQSRARANMLKVGR